MKKNKGFTIVELVIVIAVIAILAAVLIPTFSGVIQKANVSQRTQEMTNALKVVLAGNADTGSIAANTIFVTDDGYYAIYNGNKLGDIIALPATAETCIPDGTTIKSVIIPYDPAANSGAGEFSTDSLKAIGDFYGLDATPTIVSGIITLKPAEHYSQADVEADPEDNITSTDQIKTPAVELKVVSNVDLSKGMFVLSPSEVK